jgi:hypothetical protein
MSRHPLTLYRPSTTYYSANDKNIICAGKSYITCPTKILRAIETKMLKPGLSQHILGQGPGPLRLGNLASF